MSKILITGGHLTPALATIDYLQAKHPEVGIVFVGRIWAQEANRQLSWEKQEISARGLTFIDFQAQKTGSFNPFTFWQTVNQAKQILLEHQITHVLSFGGYLALPIALAAKQLAISIVTHEQTRVIGRANRLIGLLAQTLAVSYPDTKTPWYLHHVNLTGNPLRPQLFASDTQAPTWFTPPVSRPILYICGGSQGSKTINDNCLPLLERLADDYIIIHQVGRASDQYQPLAQVRQYLADNQLTLPGYFPREFLTVSELAYFYPRFHLAVARAGANTSAELTAFHVPTLYIPLPFSNYQEQLLNAQSLEAKQAAMILEQAQLVPVELLTRIYQLDRHQASLRAHLGQIQTDQDAAARLVACLDLTRSVPRPAATATPNRSRLTTSPEQASRLASDWRQTLIDLGRRLPIPGQSPIPSDFGQKDQTPAPEIPMVSVELDLSPEDDKLISPSTPDVTIIPKARSRLSHVL